MRADSSAVIAETRAASSEESLVVREASPAIRADSSEDTAA